VTLFRPTAKLYNNLPSPVAGDVARIATPSPSGELHGIGHITNKYRQIYLLPQNIITRYNINISLV